MPARYELTESQWQRIKDLLPGKAGDRGRTAQDNRNFVNGCLWVLRSGAYWCHMPEKYGNWKTSHKRFTRWARSGGLGGGLRGSHRRQRQRVPDDRHDHSEEPSAGGIWKRGAKNEALGRSRGGLSTKIHMTVDALGRPMRFILTAGQANDAPQAERLLEGIEANCVIADRGYDSQKILNQIAGMGASAVIPPRSNRKVKRDYDKELYKKRNLIERTIGKLKRFRRIATRYDRKALHYKSFLYLAASLMWV